MESVHCAAVQSVPRRATSADVSREDICYNFVVAILRRGSDTSAVAVRWCSARPRKNRVREKRRTRVSENRTLFSYLFFYSSERKTTWTKNTNVSRKIRTFFFASPRSDVGVSKSRLSRCSGVSPASSAASNSNCANETLA